MAGAPRGARHQLSGYRSVTFRDVALKPLTVGFTHGTPSDANWLQTEGDDPASRP